MYRELTSRELTPEQFEQFGSYIREHSGIHLEPGKRDPLRISLVTRATHWGCVSLDEYYEMLRHDDNEFVELLNLITINETSFFRFPAQFEALRHSVVPRILDSKPEVGRSFKVWSAGCATGEEAYSIAMTLLDSQLVELGYRPEVVGTDVSTQALDRARSGVYPAKALANVPDELVARYFEYDEGSYSVTERLRQMVDFTYHNLVKEPYPVALAGNWDVVFCRNVTIYFDPQTTRSVVDNLFDSLNPGGFLFIGHSETLTSVSDKFEPLELDGVFLYRKPLARRSPANIPIPREIPREPDRTLNLRRRPSAARLPASDTADSHSASESLGSSEQPHRLSTDVGDTSALSTARRRLAEGDIAAALAVAGRILESDPRNVDALLISAYAHADSGEFTVALEECHRTLAANPLVAGARFVLGVIFMRLEEHSRAIAEFKRALYIDADFVLARFHLANLYRSRGSLDEACREYENTLRTLARHTEGDWTVFMDGFTPDVLARTCERALSDCRHTVASG